MSFTIDEVAEGLDAVWVLVTAFMIALMQCGFAMLEVGCVRAKNVQNVLAHVMMNFCIAVIMWWAVGYSFALGPTDADDFLAVNYHFSQDAEATVYHQDWLFQWGVAAAGAAVIACCLEERTTMHAYALLTILYVGWVYPICVHWTWGGGWLAGMGYKDFAGSGIIHMTGGTAGVIGAYVVGSREGRFDENRSHEYRPHNAALMTLGNLLLLFCWFGFNAGSSLGAVGQYPGAHYVNEFLIGLVSLNTLLSAAAAALTSFIIRILEHLFVTKGTNIYDLGGLVNGLFAGLVSVTGPCAFVTPYAAFCIGIVGACVYEISARLEHKFKIDDPVEAWPVHGGCGAWGAIAVGIFDTVDGVFYGGSGHLLGVQLLGVVTMAGWTFGHYLPLYYIMKRLRILRVSSAEERTGLDLCKHGGPAYHDLELNVLHRADSIIPELLDEIELENVIESKVHPDDIVIVESSYDDDSSAAHATNI